MIVRRILIDIDEIKRLLKIDSRMEKPPRMSGIVLNIKASLNHSGRDHDQHAADLVFLFLTCRVYKVEFRGAPVRVI